MQHFRYSPSFSKKERKLFSMAKTEKTTDAVYDASSLGVPKQLVLGVQHLFAMFGSTILVPILTGLSVSATLLFAGVATLIMHWITGKKVPVFLGSSFAFLAGYFAVVANGAELGLTQREALPYACAGVACAGLLYLVLALICKVCGSKNVMRFFPPVVTGPIIIAIGLILAPSAINSCSSNWLVALVAIVVIIVCNIWGKGMIKIIPILMGVIASYLFAAITGKVDFSGVASASWVGLPVKMEDTVFSLFTADNFNAGFLVSSIVMIMPIAFATMMEHVGDISAIGGTIGKNLIEDPGLHRTLVGDGIGTTIASLFGAPANTTYGENTGVLILTKVYDPAVVRLAAVFAIILSFCPKFAALIAAMPSATVGGVSIILYGMISSVGVRNMVENHTDFQKSRNVIVAAVILGLAVGINFSGALGADITTAGNNATGAITFTIGSMKIALSGLAVASIVGIVLNAILPGKRDEYMPNTENSGSLGKF